MSATIYAPLQHSKVLPRNVDTETHIIFQPGTPDRSLLRFRRRHFAVVQPDPHTINNEYQVDDEAKDVASKPMQSESEVQVPSLLALAQTMNAVSRTLAIVRLTRSRRRKHMRTASAVVWAVDIANSYR